MKSYWQQKGQYFALHIEKAKEKKNQTIVLEVLAKSKQILLEIHYLYLEYY